MTMTKPLIISMGENPDLAAPLHSRLRDAGYEIRVSPSIGEVHTAFQEHTRCLVMILASRNCGWDGVRTAEQIRQRSRRVPLILVASDSSEQLAIAALKAGVNDYFKDPLSFPELEASIGRYLVDPIWQREVSPALTATGSQLRGEPRLIGDSEAMQNLKAYIPRVAASESNVLITGETGTGKELVAELIHRGSSRCQKPFVSLNCAAIPEPLLESELFGYEKGAFTGALTSRKGKFELAEDGTVFLDEVGDLTGYAQAKLLRAIGSKEMQKLGGRGSTPFSARIISATNQEIDRLTEEGKFRHDLYYRLNVARIHLTPLRDRKEDISSLLDYYIRELNHRLGKRVKGFTQQALEALVRYPWPGNVRELRNFLEATFIDSPSPEISSVHFPEHFRMRFQKTEAPIHDERDRLLAALVETNWNKSKAAQNLDWSRTSVYRKMEKYHIIRWRRT